MKLNEIIELPTDINNVHESCYRSYHTLNYVGKLLRAGTPPDVIIEMVEFIAGYSGCKEINNN